MREEIYGLPLEMPHNSWTQKSNQNSFPFVSHGIVLVSTIPFALLASAVARNKEKSDRCMHGNAMANGMLLRVELFGCSFASPLAGKSNAT